MAENNDHEVPPGGWEAPGEGWEFSGAGGRDCDAAAQLARTLIEAVPAELRARLIDAVRALLAALRALLEWWIERLERRLTPSGPAPEARDIPVL